MKDVIVTRIRLDGAMDFTGLRRRCQKHGDFPLKACVVFDNGASARSAKGLLRRVSRGEASDPAMLRLDEHLLPQREIASASANSDADLMVVAMQTDSALPLFANAWLDLWISLRVEGQDGALVALVTNDVVSVDSDSPLVAHLKTVAIMSRLAFFYGHAEGSVKSEVIGSTARQSLEPARLAAVPDWISAHGLPPVQRWGINE
jgi:hypothetical protein